MAKQFKINWSLLAQLQNEIQKDVTMMNGEEKQLSIEEIISFNEALTEVESSIKKLTQISDEGRRRFLNKTRR